MGGLPDLIDENRTIALMASIAKDACDISAKQYEDYYKGFVELDNKAQATVTVGGVVLGAILAFINAGTVQPLLAASCIFGYLLVLGTPTLALSSVIVSFFAMKVVDVCIPYSAFDQIQETFDLCKISTEEFSQAHVRDYYLGRLSGWEEVISDIEAKASTKAKFVLAGQILFMLTLVLLLALFIGAILNPPLHK